MTVSECDSLAQKELLRLEDIQKLLQAMALVFCGDLTHLKLHEVLL